MNRISASSRGKYPTAHVVGVIEIESVSEGFLTNGGSLCGDATLKQVLARLSAGAFPSNGSDRYIFPVGRVQADLKALTRELNCHTRRLTAAIRGAAR